jgi:hydrogenase expression/formation protein HypC
MCLAVPGRIEDVLVEDGVPMGRVTFSGVLRKVCLAHVPEAVVGDYVLVHVGFALSRIDEAEAKRTLELLAELGELQDAMSGELDADAVDGVAPATGKEHAA